MITNLNSDGKPVVTKDNIEPEPAESGDDDAELEALLAQLKAQAEGQFFDELNSTNTTAGTPQFDIDVAVAKIFEESFEGDFQKCEKCKYPITGDDFVEALGKVWHPYHLQCGICTKSCGGKLEEFRELEDIVYCENCYLEKHGPRCATCNKLVVDGYMQLEGVNYCQKHYHEKMGTLCVHCNKPIEGTCVSAAGKRWHPDHFVCSYCAKKMEGNQYKEKDQKPYCVNCYKALFE